VDSGHEGAGADLEGPIARGLEGVAQGRLVDAQPECLGPVRTRLRIEVRADDPGFTHGATIDHRRIVDRTDPSDCSHDVPRERGLVRSVQFVGVEPVALPILVEEKGQVEPG